MFVLGSLAFSFAVGIKMSVLLAAPGVMMFLLQTLSARRIMNTAMIMLQVQVLLAVPFISTNFSSYVARAFQLNRRFQFQWTVNWKFVGEEVFSSQAFAVGLLVCNLCLLALFSCARWNQPTGLTPAVLIRDVFRPVRSTMRRKELRGVHPEYVMTTILASLLIGLLCARSLHFQFFAYIAWATPFLLWRAGSPVYVTVTVCAAQEWAWNTYPSTKMSSVVVVLCLAIQVTGVFLGTRVHTPKPGGSRS